MRIVFAAGAIADRSPRPIRQLQYSFPVAYFMGKHPFSASEFYQETLTVPVMRLNLHFSQERQEGLNMLPNELQSKLNLTRCRCRRCDLTGTRNRNAICIKDDITTA